MSFRKATIFFYLAAIVLVAAGCGKKTFKLVPVKGNITVDGKPMGDLMIQFMPDIEGTDKLPEGPTSFAVSDASGNFELKTFEGGVGAMEGLHRVTVVDQLEERPAQGEQPKNTPRLNSIFATTTAGLKATIEAGKDVSLRLDNKALSSASSK